MVIEGTQTLRDAAAIYLKDRKDAGVDAGADVRWVRMRIGPIPFAFPNTTGRKRLVLARDLHHLLAGYGTDLIGEAEMGAWELGTRLRNRSAIRYAIRGFGFMLPRLPAPRPSPVVRGRTRRNL